MSSIYSKILITNGLSNTGQGKCSLVSFIYIPNILGFLVNFLGAEINQWQSALSIILTTQRWKRTKKQISKYLYIIPKPIVSASQTVRFSSRNGPFCVLKRMVLECKMACISNRLRIKEVQRCVEILSNTNYFYILSLIFSCCSKLLLNNIG